MNDKDNELRQDNDEPSEETVGVSTGGILASNLTAGNSASSMMTGTVGGGPASGVAANADVDDDEENTPLNLDALDTLDGYGNTNKKTGDDGVSQAQSELEAGEMNG